MPAKSITTEQVRNAVAQERKRALKIFALMKPGNESVIKNAIITGASPEDTALTILRNQDGESKPSGKQALVELINKHKGESRNQDDASKPSGKQDLVELINEHKGE